MRVVVAVIVAFMAALPAWAAGPSLVASDNGKPQALTLEALDAHVVIRGLLAETTMTITFRNQLPRVLEGELVFPLPEGATVSGYGLDIDGQMIEAAVVEKQKARVAFEKEVRKGVDPGLVEWTRGNNFRTRVYPIPAQGTRTVMLRYVSDVVGDAYLLPLALGQKVKEVHVKAEVVRGVAAPTVSSGLADLKFTPWEDRYVAEAKSRDTRLDQDLRITLPGLPDQLVSVETDGTDDPVFVVHERPKILPAPPAFPAPKRVGLFWDASLSRASTQLEAEKELIRSLLKEWKDVTVDVVVFRDRPQPVRSFEPSKDQAKLLESYLSEEPFDGGTTLDALTFPQRTAGGQHYDLHLLFSDGLGNLDRQLPPASPVPLFTVSGESGADHLKLTAIAAQGQGEHLNLSRQTPAQATAALTAPRFGFLGAEFDPQQVSEVYPARWTPITERFQLTGRLKAKSATMTLRFGYRGGPETKVAVTLNRDGASDTGLVPRFWAQRKVNDLALFPDRTHKQMTALGRRYGLVTPGTSLLVLETLEQHVEHDVEPAASRVEMRAQWSALKDSRAQDQAEAQKTKLERVVALWEDRVAWWEEDFTKPRKPVDPQPSETGEPTFLDRLVPSMPTMSDRASAMPAPAAMPEAMYSMGMDGAAMPSRSVVGADSGGGGAVTSPAPSPTITLTPWDPATPYMAILKAAQAKGRAYESYLDQRAGYGDSPAYYLDVAGWFAANGSQDMARRILSSILDLGLDDPALLRIVAFRLAEQGELDETVRLLDAVRDLRPEEPQSHRDLALALARRGEDAKRQSADPAGAARDLTRAMALLRHVVMTDWDRFAEIEVVALEELNRLLAVVDRLDKPVRSAVTAPDLDKRLKKLLALDVRIVLGWDSDLTDIDLWVVEPTGEKAFFDHRLTVIGGAVSKDFTQGYGPEEYALRRVRPGAYVIQADYFGSQQQALTGSVTVKAEVYTNYGRPNEQRRDLTLRLPQTKTTVEVGRVELK